MLFNEREMQKRRRGITYIRTHQVKQCPNVTYLPLLLGGREWVGDICPSLFNNVLYVCKGFCEVLEGNCPKLRRRTYTETPPPTPTEVITG